MNRNRTRIYSAKGRALRTVGVGGSVVGIAGGVTGLTGHALTLHETLIGNYAAHFTGHSLLQDGFVVLAGATAAGMAGRAIKRSEVRRSDDALVKRAARGVS